MNCKKQIEWTDFIREGYQQKDVVDIILNKKRSIQFQHQYDFPQNEVIIKEKEKWQFLTNIFKNECQTQKQKQIIDFYKDKTIIIDNVDRFLIKLNWKNELNYLQLKKLWPILTNCNQKKKFENVIFNKFQVSNAMQRIIEQDIDRTTFHQKNYKNILKNILLKFVSRNPTIEYVQGMNLIGLFLVGFDFEQDICLYIFEYFCVEIFPPDFFKDLSNFLKVDVFIIDLIIKNILKKKPKFLQIYQNFKENIHNLIIHPLFITLFCNQLIEQRNFLQKIFHFVLVDGYTALYVITALLLKLFFEQLNYSNIQNNKIHCLFQQFLQEPKVDQQLETLYNQTYVNFALLEQLRKQRQKDILNESEYYNDMNIHIIQTQNQQQNVQINFQYTIQPIKCQDKQKNQKFINLSKEIDESSFLMSSVLKNKQNLEQDISYFDMSCSYILPLNEDEQIQTQIQNLFELTKQEGLKIHECFQIEETKIQKIELHKCHDIQNFYQDQQNFIQQFFVLSSQQQKLFSHVCKKANRYSEKESHFKKNEIGESYIQDASNMILIMEQSINNNQIKENL